MSEKITVIKIKILFTLILFYLDNLFAYDSSENTWNWTFKHSKSNIQHSDGILSLTDTSRLKDFNSSAPKQENRKFNGRAIAPSHKIEENSFLMLLSEDCELEYCRLESHSDSEVLDTFSENVAELELESELVDYSHLSGKI